MNKLPTTCYKGVRDFPPEKKRVHDFILDTMSKTCELFGYEKYDASVLEPTELYTTKASESEEIVNEQTYTFQDRGGRSVTLRPEMTPTVARMIAASKRELSFPVRWYSIPNCFRYERPQKGRLREFWQLNADLFGVEGLEAEIEVISLAYSIMKAFGAKDTDFEIRLNDRKFLQDIFDEFELSLKQRQQTMKLLDKRAKMPSEEFETELAKVIQEKTKALLAKLDTKSSTDRLDELKTKLAEINITNVVIDTGTVRGFNYYTGVVFEIFDTNPENTRSLFGGGRYDDLASLFSNEKITGIGFGMGDVTIEEFLKARDLIPNFDSKTQVIIGLLNEKYLLEGFKVAQTLRDANISVEYQFIAKKPDNHIKRALKKKIPFVLFVGEKEIQTGKFTLKDLKAETQFELTEKEIMKFIAN